MRINNYISEIVSSGKNGIYCFFLRLRITGRGRSIRMTKGAGIYDAAIV
jgi:hypothetical protein